MSIEHPSKTGGLYVGVLRNTIERSTPHNRHMRLAVLSVAFFLTSMYSEAQVKPGNISIEKKLQDIRREFSRINSNIKTYSVKKQDIEGASAEGGEIVKYYKGDSLKKASLYFYGETGKSIIDYYFSENKIIFIFERSYQYNHPINLPGSKTVSVRESRLYYDKENVIRYLENKKQITNPKLVKEKDKELKEDIREYVEF